MQLEARRNLSDPPATYLNRLYLDTVLFAPAALEIAVRTMGPDHVLLGTDCPFRMGVDGPLALLASADLSDADRQLIAGDTAARMLGFEA